MRSRHTQASNIGAHSEQEGGKETYIGIFSVDTGRRDDPGLLLVLIERKGVSLDRPLDDTESGLVGDTIAVAERRGSRGVVAGHIMEEGRRISLLIEDGATAVRNYPRAGRRASAGGVGEGGNELKAPPRDTRQSITALVARLAPARTASPLSFSFAYAAFESYYFYCLSNLQRPF